MRYKPFSPKTRVLPLQWMACFLLVVPAVAVPARAAMVNGSAALSDAATWGAEASGAQGQDGAEKGGAEKGGAEKGSAKKGGEKDKDALVSADQIHRPVLWKQQADIASLDLYEGPGGVKHEPQSPFTFVQESKSGTNPKFDVTDAGATKWRVKLGDEAKPEVVASRLLWAMGYYATYDYVLPTAPIHGIKLKRGADQVKNGVVQDARFAHMPGGEKKIGRWAWKTNPFDGKRELNGLRVMMAVMNNWDLKDVNNAVYNDSKTGEQLFLVSDVGATFGSNGMEFSKSKAKGNLDSFEGSKFITTQTPETVSFGTPSAPTGVLLASFGGSVKSYAMRKGLEWIGRDVPVADAAWMGGMLAQMSHKQLADAFRAGNFPADTVERYVAVMEARIKALTALQAKP